MSCCLFDVCIRPKADIDTNMQASDPDKGRGRVYCPRPLFCLETTGNNLPDRSSAGRPRRVAPSLCRRSHQRNPSNGVCDYHSGDGRCVGQSGSCILARHIPAMGFVASRLPGTVHLQLHTQPHRRRSNSPGTPHEIGCKAVPCRVGLDQADAFWWSPWSGETKESTRPG